jgi:hypothetical protein
MKSVKLACIAFALITLAFTSCKKSSDNKPPAGNSLSLKFNGTTYSTSNIVAVDSIGYFQLIGTISSTANIYMYVLGGFKVGSFDLASATRAVNFTSGTGNSYASTAGTITITSLTSTTISGTFNFTGTNNITGTTGAGTDGTFTTTYTTTR